MILADREDIAEQLWLRDEPDLAEAMLDTDDTTHRRVMELAAKPLTGYLVHSEVDQLLIAAAVRVLTGSRRRPRSWEALPEKRVSDLWERVGPHRDGRADRSPEEDITRLLDDL